MMRRLLVVPLALGALLASALPAQASFPGGNGRFAFSSSPFPDVPSAFLTREPGGGTVSVSTGSVLEPSDVSWSPDGSKVTFSGRTSSDATRRALFVMDADGTDLRQVGRGDRYRTSPVWSPDGNRLAFAQGDGAATDVYTIAVSGANLVRLTPSASYDGRPDWSPDGATIGYECTVNGAPQVCLRGARGGGRTVLTAALGFQEAGAPAWSPSGRNLAFTGTLRNGQSGVFRASRSGTDLRFIAAEASGPVWSPDATRIAYVRWCGDEEPCYLIESARATDGADRQLLVGGNQDGWGLGAQAWQPLR